MSSIFSLSALAVVCGYIIAIFLGFLAYILLRMIYTREIDLSQVISEPTGDASLSRLQFLIFTFVIALSLFLIIASEHPLRFPDIPPTVLTLIGISGSSYLVSKGIQFSDPAGVAKTSVDIVITPSTATVHYGQSQQFHAEVPRKPNSAVAWAVIAGDGTITADGLYTAPPAATAAVGSAHATIQVTSVEFPNSNDLAVINLV